MSETLLQEIRILEFQLAQQPERLKSEFRDQLNSRTKTYRQNLALLLADTDMPIEKKLRKLEINVQSLLRSLEKMS